jgi:hypothetical protein
MEPQHTESGGVLGPECVGERQTPDARWNEPIVHRHRRPANASCSPKAGRHACLGHGRRIRKSLDLLDEHLLTARRLGRQR